MTKEPLDATLRIGYAPEMIDPVRVMTCALDGVRLPEAVKKIGAAQDWVVSAGHACPTSDVFPADTAAAQARAKVP